MRMKRTGGDPRAVGGSRGVRDESFERSHARDARGRFTSGPDVNAGRKDTRTGRTYTRKVVYACVSLLVIGVVLALYIYSEHSRKNPEGSTGDTLTGTLFTAHVDPLIRTPSPTGGTSLCSSVSVTNTTDRSLPADLFWTLTYPSGDTTDDLSKVAGDPTALRHGQVNRGETITGVECFPDTVTHGKMTRGEYIMRMRTNDGVLTWKQVW